MALPHPLASALLTAMAVAGVVCLLGAPPLPLRLPVPAKVRLEPRPIAIPAAGPPLFRRDFGPAPRSTGGHPTTQPRPNPAGPPPPPPPPLPAATAAKLLAVVGLLIAAVRRLLVRPSAPPTYHMLSPVGYATAAPSEARPPWDPLGLATPATPPGTAPHGRLALLGALGLLPLRPPLPPLRPADVPIVTGLGLLPRAFLLALLPDPPHHDEASPTPRTPLPGASWDPLGLRGTTAVGRLVGAGALGLGTGDLLHAPALTQGLEATYLPVLAGVWLLLLPFVLLCEWPVLEALGHEAAGHHPQPIPVPIDPPPRR